MILVALPYLLVCTLQVRLTHWKLTLVTQGMSQALIIMRVNMFKLQSIQHLAEIITGPSDHLEVWTDMCLSLDRDSEASAGRDDVDDHSTVTFTSQRYPDTEQLGRPSNSTTDYDSTIGCSDCSRIDIVDLGKKKSTAVSQM